MRGWMRGVAQAGVEWGGGFRGGGWGGGSKGGGLGVSGCRV